MQKRIILDNEGHAHYITFSCYKRRCLLDDDRCKRIVIGVLDSQIARQNARCFGFVVMPDHVHSIVWFPQEGQLSVFVKLWKKTSSYRIKRFYEEFMPRYSGKLNKGDPVWQRHYYSFNIFNEDKLMEKLQYIHNNPVRAGLVSERCKWLYSSARFYERGQSVGMSFENLLFEPLAPAAPRQ